MSGARPLSQGPEYKVRERFQDPHWQPAQAQEPGGGAGHQQCNALRAPVGDGLGYQLTQHHQHGGDYQEGASRRDRVRDRQRKVPMKMSFQRLLDRGGDNGFPQPSHQQARHGDAELYAGKEDAHVCQ